MRRLITAALTVVACLGIAVPRPAAQTAKDTSGGLPGFGVRVGARRKTFVLIVNDGHRIKLDRSKKLGVKPLSGCLIRKARRSR
jgi:hypothetical protein